MEKAATPPPSPTSTMHVLSNRRSKPIAIALFISFVVLVYHISASYNEHWSWTPKALFRPGCSDAAAKDGTRPVPLEAHIMSKCPDARDCLKMMVLPAMQAVHPKVDWKLSFIGKPGSDDGVACKHGPGECMGNIILLCTQQLYPNPKTSLGFTMCLERAYKNIAQHALIEDCALEHAVDIKALDECVSRDNGAYGMELLGQSVRDTIAANVTKSCTVRLNGEVFCIRDGGKWKECPRGSKAEDLVGAVEKLWGEWN